MTWLLPKHHKDKRELKDLTLIDRQVFRPVWPTSCVFATGGGHGRQVADLHGLRWLQTDKLRICTASASGLQTNNVGVIEAVEAAEAAEGLLPSGGHISQCVILRQFFIY